MEEYGVEMEKYFKFNSSHFVTYKGFREKLHGHNYKVSLKIKTEKLDITTKYVIDFDELKPIMSEICDNLKHCVLIPKLNDTITITEGIETIEVKCEDGTYFTFPINDVRVIETDQISAERLAKYITTEFMNKLKDKNPDMFSNQILKKINVKVYEDKGKCGIFSYSFK